MVETDPVLIVGAGPTGLTLANDLARRGVPFSIIDAKAGPTQDSKGLALNISSQYGLQFAGLGRPFGKAGKSIGRLNLYWSGKRYSSINFGHLPFAVQSLITQPQSVTEGQLIDQLSRAGHNIRWSHKLLELQEHKNAVVAKIATPDGHSAAASYAYVVGCDGKRSSARQYLQTPFHGVDYDMHFVLGDFHLDLALPPSEVQYFVYPDTFFIVVPIGDKQWRIVVKRDGPIPDSAIELTEMEAVLQRRLGKNFKLTSPTWISRAPFYNRVSDKIKAGRVMLAGDAAHLFSPIGGTGMNTGIQDALNLGWKLAFVQYGISHPRLLDSYESERLPAIRQAADLSDLSTQLITRKIVDHPVLDSLAPAMANRRSHRSIAPYVHSGVAQHIELPQLPPDKSNAATGPNIGRFSVRLFALLDAAFARGFTVPNHTALCFIDLDVLATQAISPVELARFSEAVLKQPQATIIFHYSKNKPSNVAEFSGKRKYLHDLCVPEGNNAHDSCVLQAVRPDGIVFHESSHLRHEALNQTIAENFQLFSQTLSTQPEALHENVC